jgi:MYXO-CTERM domain-containing protein
LAITGLVMAWGSVASAKDLRSVESNRVAWAATRDTEEPDVNSYYGADAPTLTDISLTSPPLQVSPTGSFSFSFQHRYAFEVDQDPVTSAFTYYDGGVIEISTDQGATWTDIGAPLYVGALTTGGLNPLEGRQAVAGISTGYPAWLNATINLGTAYQGQTVQVRFRIGTNVAVGSVGWDIDHLVFSGASRPPVANAGPDNTVDERTIATLNGTGSNDPDGDPLTYAWTQTAGPVVVLNGPYTASPTFGAPEVQGDTVLTFQLTVSDGTLSATDTVNITVHHMNRPPVVDAGPDQTVSEGTLVLMQAFSSDPDPHSIIVRNWTQTAGPQVTLNNPNIDQPTFTAPQVTADTVLTFILGVHDGELYNSDTVSITIRDVANNPPVANAGPDQMVDERSAVTLDGRGSSDPDGNPLAYTWSQTAGPAVALKGANTSQPTFTAPEVTASTTLTFQLTVSDGTLSATDTVSISVREVNRAPVAHAGNDQTVDERGNVTLDGRGSADPDGAALTYAWTQTGGASVALSGGTTAQPSFIAPEVTASTALTFQLTVSDGTLSASDTVVINVRNVNRAPMANAGPDNTVDERGNVTLEGAASSDPDGDALTYTWNQTGGPSVTLSGANTASPTFGAPEVTATTVLTFRLTVSDSTLSATDTVSITVRNVNRAPVVDAGADQTVNERTSVTLDGRGSFDPDSGTTLTYAWSQTGGPPVTLSGANTAQPTFTALEVTAATTLTFQLTVSDGTLSASDTVVISVRNANRAPTANAGNDQTVDERSTVTLNGGGADPDGDTLTYTWTQLSGPAVTLTGGNTAQPTFTAPEVIGSSVISFSLVVSDGTDSSTADRVVITVRNVNRAPTVNAGNDQTVDEGAAVALSGSGTDPDGDTLSYTWTQAAGTPAGLSGATTAQPSFTAPSVTADTVLTFQVTVSDGTLSATDTVSISVRNVAQNRAPVANAGPDNAVDESASVTLEGGGTDPDGNPLTYAWSQLSGPNVALTGGNTANPTFTAPSVATDTVLMFQLTVSDGTLSHSDTVSITVRNEVANRPPTASAGADQTVEEGTSVTLSGSGTDPDGDALTYAWTQTAGPGVALSDAASATANFPAPDVSANTVLTFSLKVTDARGQFSEDSVSITVTAKTGGGGDEGGGCSCSSDSSAAGSLMPLLMIGMALLGRRRQWLRQ